MVSAPRHGNMGTVGGGKVRGGGSDTLSVAQGKSAAWKWHDGIVQKEGPSVGDLMGRVTLARCTQLCEEQREHTRCR